ncbi:MAG: single-stranded-DNA-specific exonuclease RecJ [Candidatus Paceibacterota bacterium]
MTAMQNLWQLPNRSQKANFKQPLSEIAQNILANRRITEGKEVVQILEPDYYRDLHDPFLMKDMKKAVTRILKAIKNKEKILIFGDYDADGVPATALLVCFFEKIGFTNFETYIPDRHNEQYGLSTSVVKKFATEGFNLIITVDCGVSNIEEVKVAKKLGLEVVVTDHHTVPEKRPLAVAVVDPKRPDDTYPYKYLSGTGVAFKLVQALIIKGKFKDITLGWEKWLLDLVAIATVADMVPITGENKVLVNFGLRVLQKTRRVGLLSLFNALKLKPHYMAEDDIGFMIGPRINSAGRMAHANDALNLILATDSNVALKIAGGLEDNNKARRNQVEEILVTVDKIYKKKPLASVIVCGRDDWGLGVLGLAAGRVSEKYNRTTFIWARNGNGDIKGSCRSDGSINVVELMALASKEGLFLDFGGHEAAGGFSLAGAKLEQLEEVLNKVFEKLPQKEVVEPLEADMVLEFRDVSWSNYKEIEKLAPYGIDFPKPVFWFKNLTLDSVKEFGKTGGHLEIKFTDSEGVSLAAIAFFACHPKTDLTDPSNHFWSGVILKPGQKVEILAHIEKSTFKWKPELRLRIVDMRKIT